MQPFRHIKQMGLALHLALLPWVVPAANSNLELTGRLSRSTVTANEFVTCSFGITNLGPGSAGSVVLTNWLPAGAALFAVSASQGTYATNAGVLLFSVGTLNSGAGALAQITFCSSTPASLTNRAWVVSSSNDPQASNNGATNIVTALAAVFQPVGSMSAPRKWHTATLLANGKVLITGGTTTNGLTASAELFDPITGTFTPTGNMLQARHQHSATLLNDGRVLIVGAVWSTDAEVFNPATGTFTNAGVLNVPRWNHAASRLPDGRVLVTGGYGDEASAETFDPVAGTWSLVGRMNVTRVYHVSLPLADGRTLLAGGYASGTNADLFLPATNGFAPGGGFLKSRSFATILRLTNDTVLLAGGNDVSMMFDADLYLPALQSSIPLGPMISSRFESPGVVQPDGRALLVGGTGYLGFVTPTAEWFDPVTSSFSPAPSLNARRSGHTATLLADGRVLVAGGYQDWPQGGSLLASAEVLDLTRSKTPPAITAADVASPEGNSGTNWINFTLTLSAPLGVAASVDYEVSAGTATYWDDFIPVSGTVVFPPGTTNQTVSVPIFTDTIYELDETIFLNLRTPTNAVVARAAATGTILNDEPIPTLGIPAISLTEADRFATNITVPVLLSAPSSFPVTCRVATSDGSAVAGLDYVATNRLLVFAPGQTNLSITVTVNADTLVETNETILFTLTQNTNAVAGGIGTLTILDNDGIPGKIHHFEMDPMPDPSYLNDYAVIFIYAKDFQGNPANYSGPAFLELVSAGQTNYHWDFEDGTLNGWTPLSPFYGGGPYEVVHFDTGGDKIINVGFPSRAFRIRPNYGPADGLTRTVPLLGGVPYNFSFSIAESNEGAAWEYAGASAQLYVNSTNIGGAGWSQYDLMAPGLINRSKMSVSYKPPTNGLYTLNLTVYREAWESPLYAYIDDIRIEAPRVTPLMHLMWVGMSFGQAIVRVHDLATNVTLRAYDLEGHSGSSNPFNVLPSADLQTWAYVEPTDGVNSCENITLTVGVGNAGPSPANNIVVTNILPAEFQLLSATGSPGAWVTNFGNTVIGTFSNFTAGAGGYLSLQARTTGEGLRTNRLTITASEHDSAPENNSHALEIGVQPPFVSISGTSVMEISGGTNALLSVWLASSNDVPVSVNFATTNLSATSGADYTFTTGTVIFPPGVTNQTLLVTVLDDSANESNETFRVQLSNPSHALLAVSNATVTIVNDDPPPALTLHDTTLLEGDASLTQAVFAVTLSAPSEQVVTVFYSASPGTALADTDYLPSGPGAYISFLPGQTNQTITVFVRGNTVNEPDETFFVTLASPQNATLDQAQAIGTILNDDAVPGRLDHFVFDAMAEARRALINFPIRVNAVDAFGALVTNYTGTAQLSAPDALNPGLGMVTPGVLSNFNQGVWTGDVVVNKVFTNGTLLAQDDAEHVGQSTPFKSLATFPLTLTLPVATNENAGVLTNAGKLTTLYTNDTDIQLILTSGNTNLLLVAVAILPAGQTNATFDVTVLDDALLNATRFASISATGPGFATNSATMNIHDNEVATLTLAPSKTNAIVEGGGTVQLQIGVFPPPDVPCQVFLTSSDPTELTVPAWINVSAGSTSAIFNATIVNDTLIDGPQPVTVTAHVENWVDGAAAVTVLDNEGTNLALVMQWQGPYVEGMGTITNFRRVQISGTLPTNLVVQLASSDNTELAVPATVTILAGQTFTNFSATLPDDAEFDGTQNTSLIASAPGFGSATNIIPVSDNDPHHFVINPVASPRTSAVPFQISLSVRDVNDASMLSYSAALTLGAVAGSRVLPMTPAGGSFVRGSWTGNVTVNSWGTNAQIRATATNGVSALSNPFTVVPSPWSGPPAIMTQDGYFGLNDGRFGFNLRADDGTVVVVEASTNLLAWAPVHTNVLGAWEIFFFNDLDFAQFPWRFYRARLHEGPLPPPSLHDAALVTGPGSLFGFNLTGVAGQGVIVEASINLLDWAPLQTNTLGSGPLYFSDPESLQSPQRFYRLRVK